MESGARIGKVDAALHRWRDHEDRLSRVDARYGREAFARVKARYVGRIHPMTAAVVAQPTPSELPRARRPQKPAMIGIAIP